MHEHKLEQINYDSQVTLSNFIVNYFQYSGQTKPPNQNDGRFNFVETQEKEKEVQVVDVYTANSIKGQTIMYYSFINVLIRTGKAF